MRQAILTSERDARDLADNLHQARWYVDGRPIRLTRPGTGHRSPDFIPPPPPVFRDGEGWAVLIGRHDRMAVEEVRPGTAVRDVPREAAIEMDGGR